MLEKARIWLIGLSLIVVVGGVIAIVSGVGSGGGGGDGRLPPTDFTRLDHTPSASAAWLVCNSDPCAEAIANGPAPVFDADISQVMRVIVAIADEASWIRTHHLDLATPQLEFLERLPSETVPSVVAIRLTEVDLVGTRVSIYSHKPVGESKALDHAERVQRWLDAIARRIGAPLG